MSRRKSDREVAAIYAIELPNGEWYVGATTDFLKRCADHKAHIRNGDHHNPVIRFLSKTHSEEDFKFHILERVDSGADLFTTSRRLCRAEKEWHDAYEAIGRKVVAKKNSPYRWIKFPTTEPSPR